MYSFKNFYTIQARQNKMTKNLHSYERVNKSQSYVQVSVARYFWVFFPSTTKEIPYQIVVDIFETHSNFILGM